MKYVIRIWMTLLLTFLFFYLPFKFGQQLAENPALTLIWGSVCVGSLVFLLIYKLIYGTFTD